MDSKKERFLKIFISEAKEILNNISGSLIELEKEPENKETINRLFRYLHTLKGNSALEGLEKLTKISDIMENIFSLVRDKGLVLTSDDIDLLFNALDRLENLFDGLVNDEYKNTDIDDVVNSLSNIEDRIFLKLKKPEKKIIGGIKLTLKQREELKKYLEDGNKSYLIDLTFNDDNSGALNTFIIVNNLKPHCSIILSSPDESELKDTGRIAKSQVLLITELKKDEIKKKIRINSEKDVIIETDINKLPLLENEFDYDEKYKFEILPVDEKIIKDYIADKKAFYIELSFSVDDNMKNLNMFIIYNNLIKSSKLIFSYPEINKVKDGLNTNKVKIIYSGDLERESLKNIISTNCNDYKINRLTEKNAGKYFFIEKDIKEVEKKEKTKMKEKLKKEIVETQRENRKKISESATIELDKFIIDGVIENIGEMVVNLNFISNFVNEITEEKHNSIEEVVENLKLVNAQIQGTTILCNTLMDYAVLMRLVPLKILFQKLPRIIRDATKKSGKKINYEIIGERVRVDQDVMHILEGPLVHILRNSIDHGIETKKERIAAGKDETGFIKIKAYEEHRYVFIEVEDDGKGINKDKVLSAAIEKELLNKADIDKLNEEDVYKFLFHPGFSTKKQATQLSGRGVGLDVVLNEVENIGGSIEIDSEEGKGSVFRLKFPIMI